jgi:hypothetical protein
MRSGQPRKHQRADHDDHGDHEPRHRRGTAARLELLAEHRDDHRAENHADDLGPDVLDDGRRMQFCRARRIADKARDAEAHVSWVAERGQQYGGSADDHAGQDDPEIPFFHVFPQSFLFFESNAPKRCETDLHVR